MGTRMARFLAACVKPSIRRQALKVSLVVGTLLNLINQGATAWHGGALSLPHLLLNYLVPFCVSTYSAAKNEVGRDRS